MPKQKKVVEQAPPSPAAARVLGVVEAHDFRWRNEKDLQDSLAKVFAEAGIAFEREKTFAPVIRSSRQIKRADGAATTLTRIDTQLLPVSGLEADPKASTEQIIALGLAPLPEVPGMIRLQVPSKERVPCDRPDFYLPDGRIVVEVKTAGGPSDVMRQIFRYAQLADVAEVILVTGCSIHQAMPSKLVDKPIHVAYVGGLFGGFR